MGFLAAGQHRNPHRFGRRSSTHLFKALHNLRSDRSRTVRTVLAERTNTADTALLREARDAEMPALKAGLATLQGMSFPGQPAMVAELDQRINTLTRIHAESMAASARPKNERPAGSPRRSTTKSAA